MNVDAIKKPLRMITNEQIFRPTADFFLQKCLKKELTVQKQLQFKGNLGFKKVSKISILFRINFIKMIAFGLPRKIQKKHKQVAPRALIILFQTLKFSLWKTDNSNQSFSGYSEKSSEFCFQNRSDFFKNHF